MCDGHGINGHKVSGDIKVELPRQIETRLQADADFKEATDSPEFHERMTRYFRESFNAVNESLNTKPYDTRLSGSTCTALVFDSCKVMCANAGDSRAVLFSKHGKATIKSTPLSEDHKPSLKLERQRILAANGRVEPITGPQGQFLGPDRVWLKDEDTPGLAMSRSLGDRLAHSIGVTHDPEVKSVTLNPADKFIVIASDGLWEFLTNEMVARIVYPFYLKNSPEQAGNALVRAAA